MNLLDFNWQSLQGQEEAEKATFRGIQSISVTNCSDNLSSNLYPQSRCHKSAWKTLTNDFSGGGVLSRVLCESSALALPISKWAVQVNTSEKVVQQPSVPSQTVFLFLSCFSWHWQNISTQATHTKYKCLKRMYLNHDLNSTFQVQS